MVDDTYVWRVGSAVLVCENVPATITGILIRANSHVTYECSWWAGKTHNCKWLEEFEVTPENANSVKIGFISTEKGD